MGRGEEIGFKADGADPSGSSPGSPSIVSGFDVAKKIGPRIRNALPFRIVAAKSTDVIPNESGQINNRRNQRPKSINRIRLELHPDALRDDPGFVIVVVFFVGSIAEMVIQYGKVVTERIGSHEHEVFLIVERILRKSLLRFIERQSAKVLPSADFVKVRWVRNKVILRWESIRDHSSSAFGHR